MFSNKTLQYYMKQKKAKEHSTTLNLFATFNLWLYQ